MGKGPKQKGKDSSWIHSTRVHLVLYSFLLVLTPFILLQNFLVELISELSGATLPLGSLDLPIVPAAAALVILTGLIHFRASITRRMVVAAVIVVLMDALAQQISDFYFGHRFYDLQQNWHYVAYGIFAYMMYRDLEPRGFSLVRILWLTFILALAFSSFDEAFQMRMSSRVYDVSDTAKDVWGCLMGLVLIVLNGRRFEEFLRGWKRIRTQSLSDHFHIPFTALVFMVVFDIILLSCGSLLSNFEYLWVAVGLSLLIFAVFLLAFSLFLRRWGRIALAVALGGLVVLIGIRLLQPHEEFVRNRDGLTTVRGIPIPYFDVLIYPNGGFRLVDKKHYFNPRDQQFFLKQKTDILLIGSGTQGVGGMGFPATSMVQFVYNPNLGRATQVIIAKTPEACRIFNRLMGEGKNVLFVIHSTC